MIEVHNITTDARHTILLTQLHDLQGAYPVHQPHSDAHLGCGIDVLGGPFVVELHDITIDARHTMLLADRVTNKVSCCNASPERGYCVSIIHISSVSSAQINSSLSGLVVSD